MRIDPRSEAISRRDFVRDGSALATGLVLGRLVSCAAAAEPPAVSVYTCKPLLTAALDFEDVSRGHPKPYDLSGGALEAARLTPQSWRLEIVADATTTPPVKSTPRFKPRMATSASEPKINAADNPYHTLRVFMNGKRVTL